MPDQPLPQAAIDAAAGAIAIHRWKSMGVASVECECGAILHGDADPFPADEAFRAHLAEAALAAAAPHLGAAAVKRAEARVTAALERFEKTAAAAQAKAIEMAVAAERERIAGAVAVPPGGTLVIGFNQPLTIAEAHRLIAEFRERCDFKVAIADDVAHLEARPEGDHREP